MFLIIQSSKEAASAKVSVWAAEFKRQGDNDTDQQKLKPPHKPTT